MKPWLSIVGLGEDGLAGLSAEARALIDEAEVLVGGERHLALVPESSGPQRERLTWPSPLRVLVDEIVARRGTRVCVLATGDPLWYGVGVTIAKRIAVDEMTILSGVSAFSLACARLGWSLSDVETLTLHGRPLSLIARYLQPGARLLILSDGGHTPAQVAETLRDRGYGRSNMIVFEHMGGPQERRISAAAETWDHEDIAVFNTVAVDCIADADAEVLPVSPGLPDSAFQHDGQMTKREVRAATLAALGFQANGLLWDVGAGCGSVAIEWMRLASQARAIAIERKASRLEMMRANADRLGTPYLKIVEGEAPEALNGLEAPDAIFIGGGLSREGVFETCWESLRPGGHLMANVVTLSSEAKLFDLRNSFGGDLTRIAVTRAEPVGPHMGWRPAMPVTQWSVRKS